MAGNKIQFVSRRAGGLPPWAIWAKVAMALVIIAAVSIAGCGMQVNQAPVINSLTANPTTVSTGGSSTITCNATDADGDTLTYTWSSTAGTVTGAGASVTWMAPSVDGTYTVTVTVADGKGGTATDSVDISVIVGNNPPVIASVVAASPSVPPGGTTAVTCTATDADGDTLTYTWSAPNGGAITGSGSSVTWQAPAAEDTYTVAVTVSDGQGGTDSGSTNIVVIFVSTTGSIDVQSNPSGAKVFLDGVDTHNITPYVLTGVPAGPHTIMLRKNFYKDEQSVVNVPAGGTQYVNWALTYTAPTTVTIQPGAADGDDAYVWSGSSASNYAAITHLYTSVHDPTNICRSYLKFDLSGIPATSIVTSADLGLRYDGDGASATTGPVGAYRVISTWDEGTITWDNQPNCAASPVDSIPVPVYTSTIWLYWEVDSLVQNWVDGSVANNGVMLADTDESTVEDYKNFRSSDHATATDRPKLIIQYYDPVP